jgi:hypothetical protein
VYPDVLADGEAEDIPFDIGRDGALRFDEHGRVTFSVMCMS